MLFSDYCEIAEELNDGPRQAALRDAEAQQEARAREQLLGGEGIIHKDMLDADGFVAAVPLAQHTGTTIVMAAAVIATHDVNGDGKLDATELARAKEQYQRGRSPSPTAAVSAPAAAPAPTASPTLAAEAVADDTVSASPAAAAGARAEDFAASGGAVPASSNPATAAAAQA